MPFDATAATTHAQVAGQSPTVIASTEVEARDAVREARSMFQRTLASWASDMLLLQRRGLHEPTWDTRAASQRLRRAA